MDLFVPTSFSSDKSKDYDRDNASIRTVKKHTFDEGKPIPNDQKMRLPNYHFIDPPYEEDPMDIRVLNSVCLEQLPSMPKHSRIIVYNSKEKRHGFVTHGYLNTFNITWNVVFTDEELPSNKSMMYTPAFFFIEHFPSNLFHFFENC